MKTRQQVFNFIIAHKRKHDGNSPTVREVARAAGCSVSTAHYHLKQLEDAGHITRPSSSPNTIEVSGGQWGLDSTDLNVHENTAELQRQLKAIRAALDPLDQFPTFTTLEIAQSLRADLDQARLVINELHNGNMRLKRRHVISGG